MVAAPVEVAAGEVGEEVGAVQEQAVGASVSAAATAVVLATGGAVPAREAGAPAMAVHQHRR